MPSNYNLYFNNLPGLESSCKSAGIPVSSFLCTGVSHVVVLSREKVCPRLLKKISTVDAKVITARAVNKWLVDYKVAMEHNSPTQNSTSSPQRSVLSSPLSSTITQRAELVVTDTDHLYKPQFLAKVADSNFPSYSCSGSPWDRRNSPGQPPKPSSNPQSPCSTSKPASPSNKPRTTVLQTLHRKIFCENCRVSVTDLDAHFTTLQHKKYAANNANFSDLDEVIGDSTLDNFMASQASNKRRRIGIQTSPVPIGYPFSRPCNFVKMG